ncbi:O-antigen polymerase [Pseudarthrobacter chlorophenolicus A6]|uniref:O-antigen polymerase n=1 Tax=Pseudarthrobacter chlorophenolicus (strain ATCC 700700 / DSM 12829 / CIP 107037 / JCM 12360 / KCTC 9906 / NCIMB 13794 / A6) TaxID=452863 RepID=B8H8W2_PSECP|nr:O-antigen ligase family protein [Pseudarthrobacter chlorophenolicus]ACL41857.1 O-antigen polymerase [Pseudarthrobacter chlorophenolicus A6]SDQ57341.1 O-antigen ligase [Pseudarthrobacter chlorophenolicus]
MTWNIARTSKVNPPAVLYLVLLATLVLPSYMVLPAFGASGSAGQVLAVGTFLLWLVASGLGLHNPMPFGHPGRAAMLFWIIASCASYAAMFAGFSGGNDAAGRAGADRWLILLLAGAGVTLLTTETVRSVESVKSLVRWVMAGAAFCCVVALAQFALRINPMEWVASMMVGFEDNGSGTAFQAREAFMRVAGTTMHPIELGVVCSMLLPLAIWWSLFDSAARKSARVLLPILIFAGNVITVSRTGLIGLAIAALILIPYLPDLARRWAMVVVPLGIVSLFLLVPGMVSTLFSSATAGSSDSSITYRTDDYPLAWQLFFDRPWLGLGPGSWLPIDAKDIFDNQYLLTIATMGGIGLAALLAYFLAPLFASLTAAHHAKTPETRVLAGAVGAAMLVAAVSAGTFDALSFQTFALLCPFFVGLSGVVWLLVKDQLSYHTMASVPPPERRRTGEGTKWTR